MERNISVWGLFAIVLIGAMYSIKVMCTSSKTISNQQLNQIITLNDSLMRYADRVMDNNSLWDTDGSDDMAKYLEYHAKIDSLYSTME